MTDGIVVELPCVKGSDLLVVDTEAFNNAMTCM